MAGTNYQPQFSVLVLVWRDSSSAHVWSLYMSLWRPLWADGCGAVRSIAAADSDPSPRGAAAAGSPAQ